LRFLRIMVTVLTASMILGLVTVIVLIVIRVPSVIRTVDDPLPLPATLALPDGTKATAFTMGTDWFAVITDEDQIVIFNRDDNTVRQTIHIEPR